MKHLTTHRPCDEPPSPHRKKAKLRKSNREKSCSLHAVNGTANEPNLKKKLLAFFFVSCVCEFQMPLSRIFSRIFFSFQISKFYVFFRSSLKSPRVATKEIRKEKLINLCAIGHRESQLENSLTLLSFWPRFN